MSVLKEFTLFMGCVFAGAGVMSITFPAVILTTAHIFKALEKRFPLCDKPDAK